MQEPLSILQAAKQPEPMPGRGLDAIVIPADRPLTPPSGFNPLRAPVPGNGIRLALQPEPNRWPVGYDRNHIDWCWTHPQVQGTLEWTEAAANRMCPPTAGRQTDQRLITTT